MAERALEIWPNFEKYVNHILKEPKSKQPKSASFSTVEKAMKDLLVRAKLQVFVHISKILKPFLAKYQTDKPMIMFLAGDLYDICTKLMHKFIKKDVLDSADTIYKVATLEVLNKTNHKVAAEIDIGFATKATLTNLFKKKVVGERRILEFRMDCIQFMAHTTNNILERSPMKHHIVRSLFCLNPQKMIELPEA